MTELVCAGCGCLVYESTEDCPCCGLSQNSLDRESSTPEQGHRIKGHPEASFDDRFFRQDYPVPTEKSRTVSMKVVGLIIVVLVFIVLVLGDVVTFGDSSRASSGNSDGAWTRCLIDGGYHREFEAGNETKAFAILDRCNARYPNSP